MTIEKGSLQLVLRATGKMRAAWITLAKSAPNDQMLQIELADGTDIPPHGLHFRYIDQSAILNKIQAMKAEKARAR